MTDIVVHCPVPDRPVAGSRPVASRRVVPVGGGRLVLVDNGKPRAKELLRLLGDALAQRLDLAEVVLVSKASTAVPLSDDEAAGLAAAYDLVLTGLGDCGACSSGSVEDALAMESLGVPAVAVVSEPFQGLAAAVCRRMGFPGQHFVVVRHPVSTLDDKRLAALADDTVDSVVTQLAGSPTAG
ncbi:UGSC family (seleno)protein [Plantactinospora sp. GCM10030261]|uniref:UGSC family (seleno)protein n=1 Tax=Plantactinospora sp. GCM10030261 TaxID=3273420 RepID=UPI00360904FA